MAEIIVGVPLEETAIIVKKVELTDECIEKIADTVVRKLVDYKTEPKTCQECEHRSDTEDGCADRHGYKDGERQNITLTWR